MKKKILIVDDDRLNLTLVQIGLMHSGYEVAMAQNGQQALEVLVVFKPDLIVLDIQMPEMNGYECLKKIQELPEGKIPVIMLTANEDMKDIFFMEGVRGYLVKPVNLTMLDQKIQACFPGVA